MTGGGFGGCTVALVKTDAVDSITKKIGADYQRKTGIEATHFCFPSRRRRHGPEGVSRFLTFPGATKRLACSKFLYKINVWLRLLKFQCRTI